MQPESKRGRNSHTTQILVETDSSTLKDPNKHWLFAGDWSPTVCGRTEWLNGLLPHDMLTNTIEAFQLDATDASLNESFAVVNAALSGNMCGWKQYGGGRLTSEVEPRPIANYSGMMNCLGDYIGIGTWFYFGFGAMRMWEVRSKIIDSLSLIRIGAPPVVGQLCDLDENQSLEHEGNVHDPLGIGTETVTNGSNADPWVSSEEEMHDAPMVVEVSCGCRKDGERTRERATVYLKDWCPDESRFPDNIFVDTVHCVPYWWFKNTELLKLKPRTGELWNGIVGACAVAMADICQLIEAIKIMDGGLGKLHILISRVEGTGNSPAPILEAGNPNTVKEEKQWVATIRYESCSYDGNKSDFGLVSIASAARKCADELVCHRLHPSSPAWRVLVAHNWLSNGWMNTSLDWRGTWNSFVLSEPVRGGQESEIRGEEYLNIMCIVRRVCKDKPAWHENFQRT